MKNEKLEKLEKQATSEIAESRRRRAMHTIKLESNSAGCIWVCSCGKVWAYGMHNVNAVNAHTGRLSR